VEVLKRLEVDEAQETLGVFAAVDGNQTAQKAALATKVHVWAKKITTKQLTRTETWLSLRLGIAKSLRYPLTATMLSKSDCHELQRPLLKAAFKSLGFPPTFPHAIAFAPTERMGLGFPHFWNDQAIDHLMALLKHGDSLPDQHNPNVTGCLQRDELANLRMELGLPGFQFEHPYKKLHRCTTPVWLHTTWQFCNELHLTLQDTMPQLLPKRRHDQFLMQAFLDYGYTAKQLPFLNLCRLWSRVTTLSDITTGDGRNIQRKFWDQKGRTMHQADKWPQQGTPENHCWALWRKALSKCFLRPNAPNRQLRTTLNDWILRPDGAWYYSNLTDTVFEAQNTTWIQ
jgi:hypothetical protein